MAPSSHNILTPNGHVSLSRFLIINTPERPSASCLSLRHCLDPADKVLRSLALWRAASSTPRRSRHLHCCQQLPARAVPGCRLLALPAHRCAGVLPSCSAAGGPLLGGRTRGRCICSLACAGALRRRAAAQPAGAHAAWHLGRGRRVWRGELEGPRPRRWLRRRRPGSDSAARRAALRVPMLCCNGAPAGKALWTAAGG